MNSNLKFSKINIISLNEKFNFFSRLYIFFKTFKTFQDHKSLLFSIPSKGTAKLSITLKLLNSSFFPTEKIKLELLISRKSVKGKFFI